MNWFKGSVSEAITAAKDCGGIFVVYIYDKSDLSKTTREKLDNNEVYDILSSSKYVAIEIENGSTDAIQFAQIYPLIIVPSLFFISPQNGIPLEIIGGHFEVKALVEKLQKMSPRNQSTSQPVLPSASQPVSQSEADLQKGDTSTSSKEVPSNSGSQSSVVEEPGNSQMEPSVEADAVAEATVETESSEGKLSHDDKVKRAKELANQRTEMKMQEGIEDEKQKEIERRQQLQEVNKAKKKKEEQERNELGKQRKKEKEDDRLARERVRAQIAADRAEGLARSSLLKGEQPPPAAQEGGSSSGAGPSQPTSENQNRSAVTRIKFRFPDNSSELAQFSPDATLSDVRTHLTEKSSMPYSRFKLVATMPPRSFTDEEMPLTLTELGLTPSGIIIVKPISGASASSLVPSGEGAMALFWSLIAPLTFLINYVKGILGLGRGGRTSSSKDSDEDEKQAAKRPRTEGSYTTRNRPKTAYGRRGERDSIARREGNIHRFNPPGDDDDDDENNTWNGNSTQQM